MALRLLEAPDVGVITLDEAKSHLGVLHSDDDTLIQGLILAATDMLDGSPGELNRALISQVWEYTPEDGFPGSGARALALPLAPVISLDEITYLDAAGDEQVFSSDCWTAILGERPAVALLPSANWPETLDIGGAIRIKFTAGYGATPAAIPPALKVAIKIILADLYSNRESGGVGTVAYEAKVFPTVDRLISPYRHWPA